MMRPPDRPVEAPRGVQIGSWLGERGTFLAADAMPGPVSLTAAVAGTDAAALPGDPATAAIVWLVPHR